MEENGNMEDFDKDILVSQTGRSCKGDSRTIGRNQGENIDGFHVGETNETEDPTPDF